AVFVGHDDVGDHDIRRILLDTGQRGGSVGVRDHVDVLAAECDLDDFAHGGAVIDKHYRWSARHLDLPFQQTGALIEFAERIQHQLGRGAQYRPRGGAGARDKFVNSIFNTVRAFHDGDHGVVADQFAGLGMGNIAIVKEHDSVQIGSIDVKSS